MSFTILFALFALTMVLALVNRPRLAEALFLLTIALSVAVFLKHATDTLAISL